MREKSTGRKPTVHEIMMVYDHWVWSIHEALRRTDTPPHLQQVAERRRHEEDHDQAQERGMPPAVLEFYLQYKQELLAPDAKGDSRAEA